MSDIPKSKSLSGSRSESDEAKQSPLHLIEDGDTGDRLLIYAADEGIQIELRVEGDTFWATQRQMADAFGVTPQNVTMHLRNIFEEGELSESAVCKEALHTGRDGKRYPTKLYNLNALISIGYRTNGKLGTAFRIWATDKLIQYLSRGFVIDAKRLKGAGNHDRASELREIIRDIRAAEANVYAELRRICTLCQDYDPSSKAAREFYTHMQAKLYWATVSKTPAMVRIERADAEAPNMGVQSISGSEVRKSDLAAAKSFLFEPELRELNRLTTILLDVFEDQLDIGRLTLMTEATALLDAQLRGLSRPILRGGGTVSVSDADQHVDVEYKKFDERRRALRVEQTQRELSALKATDRAIPKLRKPRMPPK